MEKLEQEHIDMLRKNVGECAVLLKHNGDFPISPCKVALYGSGARKTRKGGTGSGDVYSRFYVTCEQGLKNAGFTVTSEKWLDAYDKESIRCHAEFIDELGKKAEKLGVSKFVTTFGAIEPEHEYDIPLNADGDVAIYVLARTSGEGNDRSFIKGDFLLTDTEIRDISTLNEQFEKFMLVLNVGGPVDLSPIVDKIDNILYLSQLGVVTGDILADILIGKVNPSGKLAFTWACADEYDSDTDFGDLNDTRYREGIYVGYKYFDASEKRAMFPFGYGLSYTKFATEFLHISNDKDCVTVSVKVHNIGHFAGKHVVQLYLSCPQGEIDKPYKQLVAYIKTGELKPNAYEELTLTFKLSDFASYFMTAAEFRLEKGMYILCLGDRISPCAAIKLTDTIITRKVKNICSGVDFKDRTYNVESMQYSGQQIIELTKSDFETKIVDYTYKETIDPLTEKLTDEQLVYLCLGAFMNDAPASIIGNSALHVCGAAGETTNHLKEILGDSSVVMADGPAGLRLMRYYIVTENGFVPLFKEISDDLAAVLPEPLINKLLDMYKATPKEQIIEQFTTAIPIGTALANSWNVDIAELCGDIVGDEMERFGVNIWLAPALNIQRSPLCGRNFEYYSEDPIISGYTAAAICKGVQRHNKCSVAIKHYCANGQEYNRYNSNSILSERALRELYLKGFEIVIRECSPKNVMTSYNLINGVHTSESKELIDDTLRNEFGFNGVVMTDWITSGHTFIPSSKHPAAYTSNIIKAGNDLTMAGSKIDLEDALNALRSGKLTRADLLPCASRVIKYIREMSNR